MSLINPTSPLDQPAGTDLSAYVAASQAQLRCVLTKRHPAHREPLGALLVGGGELDQADLRQALAAQQSMPDTRISELLVSQGTISEDVLYGALSAKFGVPYVRLGEFDVDPGALHLLPQSIVRAYRVLPLMLYQGRVIVAMRDPTNSEALSAISASTRVPIEAVFATGNDIEVAIATHYPPFDDADLQAEVIRLGEPKHDSQEQHVSELQAQEQPIVRLVTNMLHDAIKLRASDIHIRPREHNAQVLYRIDGSLVRIRDFDRSLLPAVTARIKVIAEMDLAEHRLPQDGAIHLNVAEGSVDLRISVIPAIYGENVVIRVLDRSVGLRHLADVGFTPADEQRFRSLLNRNQGLVLVTGPTGSGKTTTLYAALQELNTGEFHILTVEDPIEYRLDGIVQTQVRPVIDYSFSNALRNILRHDPDIVLIGEIRDGETARIAMESALTGHLVMSTLHTNSATQTITRLLQMGIEPYLVNSTLAGVLAQRLVRRNCEHCKHPEGVDTDIRQWLKVSPEETFFCGTGCAECNGTGFRGRIAVYELLEMSPALRAAIGAGAGDDELQAISMREGMVPLTQQALTLARTGQISLLEVFRARLE